MIARAILVVVAIAMIGTGVAFAGVSIYLLLVPIASAPASAALTALALLTVGAGATIHLAKAHARFAAPQPLHAAAPVETQHALISALTQLAKEHPLIAVACAAALGLSDAMKRKTR